MFKNLRTPRNGVNLAQPALCAPAVRALAVIAEAADARSVGHVVRPTVQVVPVLALESRETGDGLKRSVLIADPFDLDGPENCGLVALDELPELGEGSRLVRVVAAPWSPAEDDARLAPIIAELTAAVVELAQIPAISQALGDGDRR